MAAIIDEIFDNTNRPADADDSNTEIDMTFNSSSDFVVNGINQGRVTDEDYNGDLDNDDINDDENNVDDHDNDELDENDDGRNTEIINGATQVKVKCRLANVNKLCFVNIIAKGFELLEKANPFITQFRKGKGNEQMLKFYRQVHDGCTAGTGNDLIQGAFNRL